MQTPRDLARWLLGAVWICATASALAAPPVPGPDGHLYRFVAGPYLWPEAVMISADYGWVDEETGADYLGQLATIGSEAENSFVAALTGGAAAWLGAAASDGVWTWRSGAEDGMPLGYSHWSVSAAASPLADPELALVINAADFGFWTAAVPSGPDAPLHGFVVEYVLMQAVPEPAPAALLLAGLADLALRRRR